MDGIRASASRPRQVSYPELIEVARALFDPPGVAIDFSDTTVDPDGAAQTTTGTIWYVRGRLVLEYREVPDGEKPRTIATVGDRLLSWRFGEREAVSYRRYDGDVIEVLLNLVDPMLHKTAIYYAYLRDPSRFTPARDGDSLKLHFEKGEGLAASNTVLLSPLWFREHTFTTKRGGTVSWTVERPRPVDELPDHLRSLPDGLVVKPTAATIREILEYI